MRCSSCSQPVLPVVAIDIDGTLGDYHGHFLNFAQEYLGWGNSQLWTYAGFPSFKAWFCEKYHVDERTWHDIKLAYRQGAQKRSMPIYEHARHLTAGVVGAGAELWLTTTRPYLRLDNVDPDTRHWLERHGITEYTGLVYDDDKYTRLAELIDRDRVVAVVDDLPEMIEQASKAFHWRVGMHRQTRWNEAVVIDGWEGLIAIEHEIIQRIAAWKEKT